MRGLIYVFFIFISPPPPGYFFLEFFWVSPFLLSLFAPEASRSIFFFFPFSYVFYVTWVTYRG